MPGYGSKDNLANKAIKVYGSWFSQPGLVPPEPPRMLPLPADMVIGGLRDRINVLSTPLGKTLEETVNIIIRSKYVISVTENIDANVNQYLYFPRDYLRGKDEDGNPPDEGYDGDGDGYPDGGGGDGGVDYPENQKIKVTELIDVKDELGFITACIPSLNYPGYQHLPNQDNISVKGSLGIFQGTDNVLITYKK